MAVFYEFWFETRPESTPKQWSEPLATSENPIFEDRDLEPDEVNPAPFAKATYRNISDTTEKLATPVFKQMSKAAQNLYKDLENAGDMHKLKNQTSIIIGLFPKIL